MLVCSWSCCRKHLAHPDELQRHQHTCTGEKRFACSECPKSFLKGGNLSKLSRPTGVNLLQYLAWCFQLIRPFKIHFTHRTKKGGLGISLGGGTLPLDNEASLEGCNNATTLAFITTSLETICPEDIQWHPCHTVWHLLPSPLSSKASEEPDRGSPPRLRAPAHYQGDDHYHPEGHTHCRSLSWGPQLTGTYWMPNCHIAVHSNGSDQAYAHVPIDQELMDPGPCRSTSAPQADSPPLIDPTIPYAQDATLPAWPLVGVLGHAGVCEQDPQPALRADEKPKLTTGWRCTRMLSAVSGSCSRPQKAHRYLQSGFHHCHEGDLQGEKRGELAQITPANTEFAKREATHLKDMETNGVELAVTESAVLVQGDADVAGTSTLRNGEGEAGIAGASAQLKETQLALAPHLREIFPVEKTRSKNCPGTSFKKVLRKSIRQKGLYPVTGVPAPVKAPDFTEESPLLLVLSGSSKLDCKPSIPSIILFLNFCPIYLTTPPEQGRQTRVEQFLYYLTLGRSIF
ncbi:hypothetical protein A6R68_20616 [Neotoma lepida]|uniref:C2H2-type domain-containing protein n=1 Tax=Neotoma lepida TaxID=56216 RepID=A0A1A6HT84_NEOLE|nr:hypothetical protein A6R68_20616 [Neotoma lepida]